MGWGGGGGGGEGGKVGRGTDYPSGYFSVFLLLLLLFNGC